jgi:hypothetical protein
MEMANDAFAASSRAASAFEVEDQFWLRDGKGLKEPLEILAQLLSADVLAGLLTACKHRDEALAEFRKIAAEVAPALNEILRRSGIDKWDEWFADPIEAKIASLPRSGQGWPAIRVRRVRLRNIKTFKELDCSLLDEEGQVRSLTACVGDNATGKSTLLKSIVLACLGANLANRIEAVTVENLLRYGEESGSIEVEVEFSIDPGATAAERIVLSLGLGLNRSQKDFRALTREQRRAEVNHMAGWDLLRSQAGLNWGFCAGYGAFRSLRERREALTSFYTAALEIDRVLSLFQPQSTLLEPIVLENLFQADISAFSRDPMRIPLGVRDAVMQIFPKIIPDLEVRSVDGRMCLVETHSGVTWLTALSDGYNSMIGLIAHILRHALEITGWSKDPVQAEGVILIDEADLHLHPSWQRVVLVQLHTAFPNLQFIVTTHSARCWRRAGRCGKRTSLRSGPGMHRCRDRPFG